MFTDSPPAPDSLLSPLGAILAGGASRRFGSPKALARVGGRRIVDRVGDALAETVDRVVLIANEPGLFADLDLPVRRDAVTGVGPLGGIRTALAWAHEEGRRGALCVACDLPFVSPALLRMVAERAAAGGADVVAPASRGRRGVEPLCAWYSVDCAGAIDRLVSDGRTAVVTLLETARTEVIPLERIERIGDPDVLFLNVNTASDHRLAMRLAAGDP